MTTMRDAYRRTVVWIPHISWAQGRPRHLCRLWLRSAQKHRGWYQRYGLDRPPVSVDAKWHALIWRLPEPQDPKDARARGAHDRVAIVLDGRLDGRHLVLGSWRVVRRHMWVVPAGSSHIAPAREWIAPDAGFRTNVARADAPGAQLPRAVAQGEGARWSVYAHRREWDCLVPHLVQVGSEEEQAHVAARAHSPPPTDLPIDAAAEEELVVVHARDHSHRRPVRAPHPTR